MRTQVTQARSRPARQGLLAFLAAVVVFLVPQIAGAQEVPANLQIVGTISSAPDGTAPANGDEVLVVQDDETEGSGTVVDGAGTFFVEMSKDQSFNGTVLSLRLRTEEGTFQLEFGPDNTFTFNGGFPFPARTTINPTIGAQISGGGDDDEDEDDGDGDGGSEGEDLQFDVNGDGVFNQADVDRAKQHILDGTFDERADIDGNGIVNTRDAILTIQALVDRRHAQAGRGSAARERANSVNGGNE